MSPQNGTDRQGRPGFSFLVCPDSQLLRAHLAEQLAVFPPAGGPWERHVYWGDEDPPPRFWEQLSLQGLFGASRVLLVRQAQLWPAAVWKKISEALARPSAQCWPFFCLEVNWEKGQPKIPAHIAKLRCLAFADRQGWIWRHEGLTERGVKRHVQQRARDLGLTFEADALEQFCASVPPDAQAIENELQKLSLLRGGTGDAGGGAITAAMTATAAWSPECNVFACIRHMEAGNLAAVWKELSRSRDSDSLLFSLLALLVCELRLLGDPAGKRYACIPRRRASRNNWPCVSGHGAWLRAWRPWRTPSGRSKAAAAHRNRPWSFWPPGSPACSARPSRADRRRYGRSPPNVCPLGRPLFSAVSDCPSPGFSTPPRSRSSRNSLAALSSDGGVKLGGQNTGSWLAGTGEML
ncbi:MAG: DNA polymerase III subunit delta [Desulfovibrio fairfieldensis]